MTDLVQPQPAQTQPEFEVSTPPFTPEQPQTAQYPAPVAPKPKKTGVVVLAIVAVLLLGAAGAFGALYFTEKKNASDLSKQVEGKDREITDLSKKAKDSADQASQAQTAQKKAEADVAAAQKCRTAAKTLTDAAIAGDQARGEAALRDILLSC
jgi:uncharacterized protein HemX